MIIDYSAHNCWDECPGKWFERYINRRTPRWRSGLRDDALALGSLVHEGLRLWQERGIVEIPSEVQEEVTPSRECLSLAQELVYGYTRAYPSELWPLIRCEEPVCMPLAQKNWCAACPQCGYTWGGPSKSPSDNCPACQHKLTQCSDGDDLTLLAKIDSYFYVSEPTQIESGIPGISFTLNPGWWIHEYKTKSPYIPMALYMQSWEMNLQASYQVLALKHHMSQRGTEALTWGEHIAQGGIPPDAPVVGTLINVLEKPRRHIPKRKCRACAETYEFYTWVPTGRGTYACPVCGNQQELTPLKQDVPTVPPAYYRIIVTRSPEELERDRALILMTGRRMLEMERGGLYSQPWCKSACVNFQWKRACEYFGSHKNNVSTIDDPNFETPRDYRGLVTIET